MFATTMDHHEDTLIDIAPAFPSNERMSAYQADELLERRVDNSPFKLRRVTTESRRRDAGSLVRRMYARRGYSLESTFGEDPLRMTIAADTGGRTVATMTLCFDGPSGLPADENFPDALEILRAQGRRICEPSKLAIDADVPRPVFAAMMHVAFAYAHRIVGFTDWILEVNPRHAGFYRRMMGFGLAGGVRHCGRVNAPAVLLGLEMQTMGDWIALYGGRGRDSKLAARSFYPQFFSPAGEAAVIDKLMRRAGSRP